MDSTDTPSRVAVQCCLLLPFLLSLLLAHANDFDVSKYGARGDGKSDSTQGFLKAWKEACAAPTTSKFYVPNGKFVVNEMTFSGPCKAPIIFQIDGYVLAQPNPSYFKSDGWLKFYQLDSFTLTGKGTIDGLGKASWSKNQCTKSYNCGTFPTNVRLDYLKNSKVEGITSLDSKMFHFNVLGCQNLTMTKIRISAPADSANTDGIHIARSEGVVVDDVHIQTGDDCISFGDGSRRVNITRVTCGPGHGISIGSLGRYKNEEEVRGILVKNCTLVNTMFGVRVKTWPAAPPGAATDMTFEDIRMVGVETPVIIDQQYCPWNQCKGQIPSRVKISNVHFKDIQGTASSPVAVKLVCSPGIGCDGVRMTNINIKYNGDKGPAQSICSNVKPILSGNLFPKACTDSDSE